MKFIRRKKESRNKLSGWQAVKEGFEKTNSRDQIEQLVKSLVKERRLLTLADESYVSSLTLIKDFTNSSISFDKIKNWPEEKKTIRVIFKDTEKLWGHFDVHIIKTTDNDIITSYPEEIYRLQRRDHFRLLTPAGSMATFCFDGKEFTGIFARDISAGGMLLSIQGKVKFQIGDQIKDIAIDFPAILETEEGLKDRHIFKVRQAKIIHVDKETDTDFIRIGIAFMINSQEKDGIVQFVRQRELEMLRKWS